jgi:flagellar motor switch protein FliM
MKRSDIQPFPYHELKRIDLHEALLTKKILATFEDEGTNQTWRTVLKEVLETFFKWPVEVELSNLQLMNSSDVLVNHSELTLFGLFGLGSQQAPLWLVFESDVLSLAIDQVLNPKTESTVSPGKTEIKAMTLLTETVARYLLLSVVREFSIQSGVKLSFKKLTHEKREVSEVLKSQSKWALISFRVSVAGQSFFLKLILAESHFDFSPKLPKKSHFEKNRLDDFAQMRLDFDLKVGEVELSNRDLVQLKPGDILLLDQSELNHVTKHNLSGSAQFILTSEPSVSFEVKLLESDSVQVQITERTV